MLATCAGMMIVCMFPNAARYSESHKTLSNSEFRQLECTAGLHDPVVAKRGKCLSLVEKQGRMRSTAQSIGRKCEICEPPFTDLLPMVEMHGSIGGAADREVVLRLPLRPE
jgi:hypothetical protein